MNKIIAILTDPSVGGTFVTWSLHYLAGHKKYYCAKSSEWVDLVDSPLTKFNSHLFNANHPVTSVEFEKYIDLLLNTATDKFHTIYFHNFVDSTREHSYDQKIVNAVNQTCKVADKVIVLSNKNNWLYHATYEKRFLYNTKFTDPTKHNTTTEEQHQDFIDYYFSDSQSIWKDLNLTDIWDRREFLALNLKPHQISTIIPNINQENQHFRLEPLDLYNIFDLTIENLFNYLDINIDQSRLHHWQSVYQQWKKIHTTRLQFMWYFDNIIEYILKGYDMDLLRFDLDIIQESCIQQHLIYNHNLNFKTWQLEKFINTKQLHNLLEPNLHPLAT